MELNALKCKVTDITRAHKIDKDNEYLQPRLEIGGIILGQVETERLLGVQFTSQKILDGITTERFRAKSSANFGICTAQPEGLHAQGKKDGLPDQLKLFIRSETRQAGPVWGARNILSLCP
jgi:hypothetical protein